MRTWTVSLVLALAVIAAGCSYPDMQRPPVRNYAADLFANPPRPPARGAQDTRVEGLTKALEAWRQWSEESEGEYVVGPGDVLRVSVFVPTQEVARATVEAPVSEEGDVSLPLVGRVHVAELTSGQIERTLSALYADGYYRDPVVTVAVVAYGSKRVLVTGAVSAPGTLVLRKNRISLLEALLEAGGPTAQAGDVVRVIPATRSEEPAPDAGADTATEEKTESSGGGAEPVEVRISALMATGGREGNLWIGPGDIINVPEAATDYFYVLGYVRAPGAYPLPADGTPIGMLEAIAFARGLDSSGHGDKVRLVRQGPQGSKLYPVDLTRVAAAKEDDIIIQPGDVIIVRTGWGRRTIDGILHSLGLRSLAPATY